MSAHDSQAHAAMEAAAREQAVWRRRVTEADLDKQLPTPYDVEQEPYYKWLIAVSALIGIFGPTIYDWATS